MAAGKPRRKKPARRNKTHNGPSDSAPDDLNGRHNSHKDYTKPRDFAQLRVLIIIPDHEIAVRHSPTSAGLTQAPRCAIVDGDTGKPVTAQEHEDMLTSWESVTLPFVGECPCCGDFSDVQSGSPQSRIALEQLVHNPQDGHTHAEQEKLARHPWYQRFFAQVKTPDGVTVARMGGVLIKRPDIWTEFHEQLQQAPTRTSTMVFYLFNRYGHLHDKHKTEGTGIWGDEVDRGDIFHVTFLQVATAYRRHGVGKRMFTALSEVVRSRSNAKTLTTIVYNGGDPGQVDCHKIQGNLARHAEMSRVTKVARDFLHACGFRRIGTSNFFAISGDSQHQCHKLPASKDFQGAAFIEPKFTERDTDLQEGLISPLVTINEALQKLEDRFAVIGPNKKYWTRPNDLGNNLLHMAAHAGKAGCVRWLLDRFPEMATARNANCRTPLDLCMEAMESNRTSNSHIGRTARSIADAFHGHVPWYVDTVVMLQSDGSPSHTQRELIRLGCSCGKCIQGFLSERMSHVLTASAMALCMMLCQETQGGYSNLSSLPKSICKMLPKDTDGKADIAERIRHFAMCMTSSQPPTKFNIQRVINMQQSTPVTQDTYQEPSKITCAAAYIICDYAKLTSPLSGDGSIFDHHGLQVYNARPKCRNDDDFGAALLHCGFNRPQKAPTGPKVQKPAPFGKPKSDYTMVNGRLMTWSSIEVHDQEAGERLVKALEMGEDYMGEMMDTCWAQAMQITGNAPPGVYTEQ